MRWLSLIAAFAACLTLLASSTAAADSWAPPSRESYFSRDQSVRLTVTPRELESELVYFEEKVEEAERGGQRASNQRPGARGVLERRNESGRWVVVWDKPLVNEVAPVTALVADGGRYVVTFDDWGFVGTGDNVIAIYGADGSPIRSLSLSDLLPGYYIHALPHTISSIDWGGEHRIDEARNALVLKIVVPHEEEGLRSYNYVNLTVALSSGRVLPSTNRSWRNALTQAARVAALKQAADDAEAARFVAPLRAPTTDSEEEWFLYLREAFFRLDPDWRDSYPAIQVLRSPSRRDYGASSWLCKAFVDELGVDVIMIASPASPETLLRVLPGCVRALRPGALRTARIYVAIPSAYRERAVATLAPTGAQVIWIDPVAGIPQRRERLERFHAQRNAVLQARRAAGIEHLKALEPARTGGWWVGVVPLAVSAVVAGFVAFGFRSGRSEKNPAVFWSVQILRCVAAIMLAVVGVAMLVGEGAR